DVAGNPGSRPSVIDKAPVQQYVVAVSGSYVVLVAQLGRSRFDEIEQPISSRRDVRAVLDVIGRPECRRSVVITFVEQRVKCRKNELSIVVHRNTCLRMIGGPSQGCIQVVLSAETGGNPDSSIKDD